MGGIDLSSIRCSLSDRRSPGVRIARALSLSCGVEESFGIKPIPPPESEWHMRHFPFPFLCTSAWPLLTARIWSCSTTGSTMLRRFSPAEAFVFKFAGVQFFTSGFFSKYLSLSALMLSQTDFLWAAVEFLRFPNGMEDWGRS